MNVPKESEKISLGHKEALKLAEKNEILFFTPLFINTGTIFASK